MSPINGELANLPPVVLEQLEKLHNQVASLQEQIKQKDQELRDVRRLSRKDYTKVKRETVRSLASDRAPSSLPVVEKNAKEMNAQEYGQTIEQITGQPHRSTNGRMTYARGTSAEPRRIIVHREVAVNEYKARHQAAREQQHARHLKELKLTKPEEQK